MAILCFTPSHHWLHDAPPAGQVTLVSPHHLGFTPPPDTNALSNWQRWKIDNKWAAGACQCRIPSGKRSDLIEIDFSGRINLSGWYLVNKYKSKLLLTIEWGLHGESTLRSELIAEAPGNMPLWSLAHYIITGQSLGKGSLGHWSRWHPPFLSYSFYKRRIALGFTYSGRGK